MEFTIESGKSLFVTEWATLVVNNLDQNVVVDLGHNELMAKTVTIKHETDVPKVFKE